MRLSHAFLASSAAALLLAATAGTSLALEPSGTTVAVIQATSIVGSTGKHVLQPEAPIFMGDRVNTDTIGEAQLKFRDNTRLVVGPNSSLLIDKFVFSESTAKSVTINAVRGTFRFITGSSPKNAYLIRTPTATIGLRGTQFDFAIGPSGETRLALYGGGVRFCDLQNRCVELKGRCDVVVALPGGEGIKHLQSGMEKASVIDASFPYARSQSRLNADFRLDTASCTTTQINFNNVKFTPAPAPAPDPHCPPGDYGQKGERGKHARGDWSGHRGGKSDGRGQNGRNSKGGEGKGGHGKGGQGKGGGKGGNGQGDGKGAGKGNSGGSSARGGGNSGWSGSFGGFSGGFSGGKGGSRGAGGRGR